MVTSVANYTPTLPQPHYLIALKRFADSESDVLRLFIRKKSYTKLHKVTQSKDTKSHKVINHQINTHHPTDDVTGALHPRIFK